jgi:nitroreductase
MRKQAWKERWKNGSSVFGSSSPAEIAGRRSSCLTIKEIGGYRMDILEGIKTRKAIRAFKTDPVSRAVMDRIVEAACNSPSYTNTQPWEVVLVSGEKRNALSRELLKLAKENTPGMPDLMFQSSWPPEMEARSREHGARRLNTLGMARDDMAGRDKLRLANFEFYGAPCAAFLFLDGTLGEWSIYDMGLFTQNLILAAHALGVGSCLQASVTLYAAEIKQFLGMAESKKLIICISFGYPDETALLNTYRSVKQTPPEFTQWLE